VSCAAGQGLAGPAAEEVLLLERDSGGLMLLGDATAASLGPLDSGPGVLGRDAVPLVVTPEASRASVGLSGGLTRCRLIDSSRVLK
jgi:hypothetical protein